jgi:hypothetical protein
MLHIVVNKYNSIVFSSMLFLNIYVTRIIESCRFLPVYYRINDLVWQDGLLIDFLQKKILDKIIRKFLINSSYLFSERVLFKFITRFYMDFILWPQTLYSYFEFTNVAATIMSIWLLLSLVVILGNLNWLFLSIFSF